MTTRKIKDADWHKDHLMRRKALFAKAKSLLRVKAGDPAGRKLVDAWSAHADELSCVKADIANVGIQLSVLPEKLPELVKGEDSTITRTRAKKAELQRMMKYATDREKELREKIVPEAKAAMVKSFTNKKAPNGRVLETEALSQIMSEGFTKDALLIPDDGKVPDHVAEFLAV